MKLLSEFLSCLSNDVARNNLSLSSLSPRPVFRALSPASNIRELTECIEGGAQNTTQVLRLLVENEILRLNVWNNPVNDPKRGVDNIGTVEKSMTDVSRVVATLLGSATNVPSIDDVVIVR